MDQVAMVGFDMDYTLAIYRQEEIDRLSIEVTAKKLVERGYPDVLLSMDYRANFPIRGLLVDKKLGNVLKMDRYKHVKRVYHGLNELSPEMVRQLYHAKRVRPGSERYHFVDTLYALSEVSVFSAAVHELEQQQICVDYHVLFENVRACIDEAHQDGSILDVVATDIARYTIRDPQLAPTFHKLRSSGKQLFLLTNSNPVYTDHMMNYLLGDRQNGYPTWRHYFDIIISSARKPIFFTDEAPFMEVLPNGQETAAHTFERGRIYKGGNISQFESMTHCPSDRVLYVGDHIYGDVLRAQKSTAWRTAMIIQEMDDELTVLDQCQTDSDTLDALGLHREQVLDELSYRQERLRDIQRRLDELKKNGTPIDQEQSARLKQAKAMHRRGLERMRQKIDALDTEMSQLEERIDVTFHPYWGSLFKVGGEVSSFGSQVEEYACLYTDRVSNFAMYSPNHYFKSARHRMAHEP